MLKKFWERLFSRKRYVVLDVGTTGIKAFVFDKRLNVRQNAYSRISKHIAEGGVVVEQDPMEILNVSIELIRQVVKAEGLKDSDSLLLGITNQRETTIIWNKQTGQAVYPAISWEDTRSKYFIQSISSTDLSKIKEKTGLAAEPYFSASKIKWILENKISNYSDIYFGTIDTWLLWNLTKEKNHLTDHTNASRTLLFNIKDFSWDRELLSIFNIPSEILPKVKNSLDNFGTLRSDVVGFEIPIRAIIGDQQSSLFAAGREIGTTKITFGTGVFLLQILPKVAIKDGFYTTMSASSSQYKSYCLEGKIEGSGARIDKIRSVGGSLRDEVEKLAKEAADLISTLPEKPKEIVVDGGIANFRDLPKILTKYTGIKARHQKIVDGTSLGVAKLLSCEK